MIGIQEGWTMLHERLRRRNLAAASIRLYEESVLFFTDFLLRLGIRDARAVTEEHIRAYQAYLHEYVSRKRKKTLVAGTIRWRMHCVRALFETLVLEGHVFADPCKGTVHSIKTEYTLPKDIPTSDEIARLFAAVNTYTYLGFRDRTMFELLYGSGIRIGELVNLSIHDVDFHEKLLFIRQGKGSKDRVVPCTDTALDCVKEYVNKVRPVLAYCGGRQKALFVSKSGKKLSFAAIRQRLTLYRKKAGIQKRITPHSFRHSFATHLLQGGANIRYVQEILGHEELSTTMIYTRVVIADLQKELKKYHPRENELYIQPDIRVPAIEATRRHFRVGKEELKERS